MITSMLQAEMFPDTGACCLHCVHTRMLLPDCIVCSPRSFLQVLPALAPIEPCCICLWLPTSTVTSTIAFPCAIATCLMCSQDVSTQASLSSVWDLQVYLRNDMIIRAGELGREMFFIKAGAVQVCLLVSWIYRPNSLTAFLCSRSNNATNPP